MPARQWRSWAQAHDRTPAGIHARLEQSASALQGEASIEQSIHPRQPDQPRELPTRKAMAMAWACARPGTAMAGACCQCGDQRNSRRAQGNMSNPKAAVK